MQCKQCGETVPEGNMFCTGCGSSVPVAGGDIAEAKNDLIGFSSKINDPAFARYLKNSNRWSLIFSLILAAIAVFGFFMYGENSAEMDNPEALFIGIGIGAMFILIALIQIGFRKKSKTWDGTVVDKKIQRKRRKRHTSDNDYYWENYTVYSVIIRSDTGETHTRDVEDDATVYDYWQIGDRVRHHKGLNSLEKYDKSKDEIIFCNACASLNNIRDEYCHRCKCPLLK